MAKNDMETTIKTICEAIKNCPESIKYFIKCLEYLSSDEMSYTVIQGFVKAIQNDEELFSLLLDYYNRTVRYNSERSEFFEMLVSVYAKDEIISSKELYENQDLLVNEVYEDYLKKQLNQMYNEIEQIEKKFK